MRQDVLRIVLLALLLRLGAAVAVHVYLDHAGRQFLIPGDADGYWTLARQLARGDEFSMYEPPRRVMRMPGFPLFLAGSVWLGGEHLFPARLLLAGVGAAACGLVYRLGAELVDHRIGLIAAVAVSVSPALLGFSVLILSETLFSACLMLSLLSYARLARDWRQTSDTHGPRWKLALLAGVIAGITCHVRPTWLLTVPAFAAVHLAAVWWREHTSCCRNATSCDQPMPQGERQPPALPDRHSPVVTRTIPECVALMAGLVIAMLPWTIRNWQTTGHVVVTTLWVGPSMYDGLNPDATGDSDMTFFDRDLLLLQMSEYEMDREYRRRAKEFARENPGRAVWLGIVKLGRFWSPSPNADQFQQWWLRLGMSACFIPMMAGAAIGAWKMRTNVGVLLLTLGPVLYFSAIHTVFVGSLRYRLPAEYPLLILSAIGWLAVWNWWKPPAKTNRDAVAVQ